MVDNNDNNNNSQELVKLIENNQESNLQRDRWNTASTIFSSSLSFITMLAMVWKAFKPRRLSPKKRLMRKDAQIAKAELYRKWERAKLILERKNIERELKHDTELKEFETGLKRKEENEIISETTNFLGSLQSKGKEQLDKATKNIKDNVKDKISDLKDKLPI